ncbi:MAG: SCP2 sterol-binding domain-containing protein [Myxococcota bacterium]
MSLVDAQFAFYRKRVPDQFNLILEDQKINALGDPAAARVLEEMQAVRTSIIVQVDSDDTMHQTAFDIDRGQMRQVDEPTRSAFLILGHTLEDFENIRGECGDSLLGFLGTLAGLDSPMRLTSLRVRNLRELHGSLIFHRVGRNGFSLFASFGIEEPEPQARTIIRLDDAIYTALRSGDLDPQDAFLDGRIEVEGDMEMAVGLALAALSPD